MKFSDPPDGWVDCTGSFISADHIRFEEAVWRRGKRIGARLVFAEILEVEGSEPDDWVTIEVVGCEGDFPEQPGSSIRRKRRNIERNGVTRRLWDDEDARTALADGEG